jgi:putative peptidoglycan lipid II flippase
MMLMLNVPATIGLMVLAHPIVALLLQRGRFTASDTAATAAALICYAPGLLAYSAVKIVSPTFYSLRDSRTPVVVSAASVLANLGINLLLVQQFGFRGLAAGTALAAMFNAGALLWLLRRRLGGIEEARIAVTFTKILAASLAMGAIARATAAWLAVVLPGASTSIRAVHVFAGIGAGVAALLAASRALRIEEFDQALALVLRRQKAAAEPSA